jgi:hypothetical protein
MPYEFGDIVLLPFPYQSGRRKKLQPAPSDIFVQL